MPKIFRSTYSTTKYKERNNKLPTNFSSSHKNELPRFFFFFYVTAIWFVSELMHALYFCHRNSERSSRGFLKFCLSWVYLIQVEIVVGGRQSITFLFFWAQALEQFVEDVVVALVGRVSHDPRFFQEILGDLGPGDRSTTSREETSISNCFWFFFSLSFSWMQLIASLQRHLGGWEITTHFLKKICVYLPKRDELSLRTVVALPKLSSSGEASRICSVTSDEEDRDPAPPPDEVPPGILLLLTAARYCIMSLVASVFPAPLSPLMMTTCGWPPGLSRLVIRS